MIRLRKPLEYYQLKYGSWMYGLQKLYLLMEKQHNRGQDGAGVASVSLNMPPGEKYLHRQRSLEDSAINEVFRKINNNFKKTRRKKPHLLNDAQWCKANLPFAAEVYLGHLRYGTYGKYSLDNVHPVWRQNNWKTRNLVLAGNFNLTNVDELFQKLIDLGQHPRAYSDTVNMLENVGHFLDVENQRLFDLFKEQGLSNREISERIAEDLDIGKVMHEASKRWDGGYAIAGLVGHGDAFVCRDPWGIRPAYYYYNEELAMVTSERPAIQTTFNVKFDEVQEVPPGHAFIVKKSGEVRIDQVREPRERRSCSFERIYFSRGGDAEIYRERKKLGELLVPDILTAINNDLDNTVFSFIPNTAESAFYGMIKGIEDHMKQDKIKEISDRRKDISDDELVGILNRKPRVEKVAIKDIKLRTFIAQEAGREDLVGHVYDITYGSLVPGKDKLVIIDDSIVRGTTLKKSILRIMDRLGPTEIIVVSSSPQIRYPDCYGIDMAKLSDFIAFRAVIALLKETGREGVINKVYKLALQEMEKPGEENVNQVKRIYDSFTDQEISDRIARLLKTDEVNARVKIVYQSVDNLHKASPGHTGDWYFTGNYPTPGGNRVVNRSFINFIEGKNVRAY